MASIPTAWPVAALVSSRRRVAERQKHRRGRRGGAPEALERWGGAERQKHRRGRGADAEKNRKKDTEIPRTGV